MSLWSRLVNVVRGDRVIAEIDEELESHIAEAIAHGRGPEEARRAVGSSLRHRDASHAFSGMFAQSNSINRTDIEVHGASDRVDATLVSGSYYSILGVAPAAGRLLLADDDVPGAPGVAVMNDRYWQRQFARAPSA